ncbi:hypothetical protein NCU06096 [Neurospora crassa OR74A]|uniref:Uncharacterized protein n=1 Tax=Neurospora crassa (strain ATCC 24698 / 74-OR23-1A / CBS 708.71 / DSM 1257 / FGSC 987) TaxID=367110 RepID=Q7S5J1_NEUCR|nr:hypothetical protein NCU06096 [Neurospora crassa OR74A]EAA30722.3 hypothetical protein NCU06096 [Neurospora crassa OR74A]|eukprot:XP_959958.3 hypothetical protein NCU06096 [Neurospora crassa OR74A]
MVAYAIPRGRTTYTCTPDGRGEKNIRTVWNQMGFGVGQQAPPFPPLSHCRSRGLPFWLGCRFRNGVILDRHSATVEVVYSSQQLREMDDCEIWLVPHTVEEATKSQGLHDRATIPHYYTTTYMSLAVTVTLWQGTPATVVYYVSVQGVGGLSN